MPCFNRAIRSCSALVSGSSDTLVTPIPLQELVTETPHSAQFFRPCRLQALTQARKPACIVLNSVNSFRLKPLTLSLHFSRGCSSIMAAEAEAEQLRIRLVTFHAPGTLFDTYCMCDPFNSDTPCVWHRRSWREGPVEWVASGVDC